MIVNELAGRMIECVVHQNGNHVIQKCVVSVPHELLNIIIDTFVGQVIFTFLVSHSNSKPFKSHCNFSCKGASIEMIWHD